MATDKFSQAFSNIIRFRCSIRLFIRRSPGDEVAGSPRVPLSISFSSVCYKCVNDQMTSARSDVVLGLSPLKCFLLNLVCWWGQCSAQLEKQKRETKGN